MKNHKILIYLVLILIFFLGFFNLLFFRGQKTIQIITTLALGTAYIFWGILYHMVEGDLKFKIVIEYIAVSLLVSAILLTFLLQL